MSGLAEAVSLSCAFEPERLGLEPEGALTGQLCQLQSGSRSDLVAGVRSGRPAEHLDAGLKPAWSGDYRRDPRAILDKRERHIDSFVGADAVDYGVDTSRRGLADAGLEPVAVRDRCRAELFQGFVAGWTGGADHCCA